jgi:hypothetical protein
MAWLYLVHIIFYFVSVFYFFNLLIYFLLGNLSLLLDFTEFLQLETVIFAYVNTLSCAVLIFVICFRYVRPSCLLVWCRYFACVLLIYLTRFEIIYCFVTESRIATMNKEESVGKYFSPYILLMVYLSLL